LALVKERKPRILVLAPGATDDQRNPQHFPSLMQLAADRQVTDSLRVLGVIPYQDLATLMRYSVAIINPSLFEGWSTSVEEAKSGGKEILLSDIPVHREQAPERGVYFPADDPQRLASILCASLDRYDPKADEYMQSVARNTFKKRQMVFAEEYQGIVRRTIVRRLIRPA
jgi:glycosyltransferase involved in cell wall biosynthesis